MQFVDWRDKTIVWYCKEVVQASGWDFSGVSVSGLEKDIDYCEANVEEVDIFLKGSKTETRTAIRFRAGRTKVLLKAIVEDYWGKEDADLPKYVRTFVNNVKTAIKYAYHNSK